MLSHDLEPNERIKSEVIVNNAHCPSCVSFITDILQNLRVSSHASKHSSTSKLQIETAAQIQDIQVSLLNHVVSFTHPNWLHIEDVELALEEAGFEVNADESPKLVATLLNKFPSQKQKSIQQKRNRHRTVCRACQAEKANARKALDVAQAQTASASDLRETTLVLSNVTCSSCVSNLKQAFSDHLGIIRCDIILLPPTATVVYDAVNLTEDDLCKIVDDAGYSAQTSASKAFEAQKMSVPSVKEDALSELFDASLSVDGMTCASCSGSVSDGIKAILGDAGVFSVNLMGGAASARVTNREQAEAIVDEIEDRGFGCSLVTLDPVSSNAPNVEHRKSRTIRARIDGTYCTVCLTKINSILRSLQPNIDSFTHLLSTDNPLTTITYYADAPAFTLRTIRDAISSLGFQMSLVKEESIMERARKAQRIERHRILLRLLASLVFAIPTFIVSILGMSLLPKVNGFRRALEAPILGNSMRGDWVMLALAAPVQFGVGSFFYSRSWKSLRSVWRRRQIRNISRTTVWVQRLLRFGSMDALVALGTSISFFTSVIWLALGASGASSPPTSFDTSVFLIFFILGGRYLESFSKAKTGDAVQAMSSAKPSTGFLLFQSDREKRSSTLTVEIEADMLEIGDLILIPSGSAPPADAILVDNSSGSFDESALTGESRPIHKQPGDTILAGTINVSSHASVARVLQTSGSTTIDGVLSIVQDAAGKKASIELIADSVTAVFVPVIIYLALSVWIIWLGLGISGRLPGEWLSAVPSSGEWILFASEFAVAVLVASCPCGIGLAAPAAQLVGVGLAAKYGVLPKGGGEAFEAVKQVTDVVFDKTGTITQGSFAVTDMLPDMSSNKSQRALVLEILRAVEQASTHPLAQGIAKWCESESIETQHSQSIDLVTAEEVSGRGMIGHVSIDGCQMIISIGNRQLVDTDVDSHLQAAIESWKKEGKSVIYATLKVVKNEERTSAAIPPLLALGLFDPPRAEAKQVIRALQESGVQTHMCSGDDQTTANSIAKLVGIPLQNVLGGALPLDKLEFVKTLQSGNGKRFVAFVGDGINDAPSLAAAAVGIAMGSGTMLAVNTADFCLLNSSLASILVLQSVAIATIRRIYFNFGWAILYNAVLIPLAAGAFYALGRTRLPPVWASLAMALSSISVICSSLALKYTYRAPKLSL